MPSEIAKSRKILTKFDVIAVQGLLTVFETLTLKARKWLIFPTPTFFEPP